MADLATLAIKIENGDVVKATTSLNSLEVAGGKAEASTQRLTRRMALLEIAAREMDSEMGRGGRAMAAMEAEARKLDAELSREARAMALVEIEARKMDAEMTKAAAAQRRAADEAAKANSVWARSTAAIFTMRTAFAALAGSFVIREVAGLADAYTNLQSRLRLVTTGTENLSAVQAALFEQAQRTRTSFESTAELYTRLARNAGALGASQGDLLRVTETINKAMVISGASASASQAALIQLGQAFASGTLRGEELNSVMEQAPRLADAIAKGMGITIGQLRELGKEGKLTGQAVFDALKSQGVVIDAEFGKMPITIGGAMTQIKNSTLATVGEFDKMTGASRSVAEALSGVAKAISSIVIYKEDIAALAVAIGGVASAFWLAHKAAAALTAIQATSWFVSVGAAITGAVAAGTGLAGFFTAIVPLATAAGAAIATAFAPLALATAGALAIYTLTKAFDDYDAKVEEASKNTKEYVEYLKALGRAHSHGPKSDTGTVAPGVDTSAADRAAAQAAAKAAADVTASINARVRATERANMEAVRGARQELALAGLSEDAAARRQIDLQAENALMAARLDFAERTINATDEQTAAAQREYASTVARVEAVRQLAQETLTVRNAQRDADAQQRKAEEEAKQAAENQARQNERRVRDMSRNASNIIADALDGLGKKGTNIWQTWWDAGKRTVNRFMADILGNTVGQKFGEMMGIGPSAAATKQVAAGATMLQAAYVQLAAAQAMSAAGILGSGGHGTFADASTSFGGGASSRMGGALGTAATVAGSALTAYNVGQSLYSTSHGAAGNYARGAIGGAAAGAAIGSMIMPGIGTAIGALVGLTAGLFGVGSAAKASAAQVRDMRAALAATMEGLRAEVSKDSMAQSTAQIHAQSAQIRKQIEDAYSGGGANSDTVRERNRQLAELNALENERIRQLKEEAAVIAQRRIEDYQERLDAATPGNEKAEAIAANNRKLDREIEDLVRSFGSEIDATEAATLAVAQQAIAAEKAKFATEQNTTAINALTTSLHNAPQGYKYQRDVFDFATPRVMPSAPQWSVPTTPFSPPRTPLNPPTLSSASAAKPSITIAPVFQIDGTKTTRAQVQQIGVELRKIVTETLGKDADVSEGWGLLA